MKWPIFTVVFLTWNCVAWCQDIVFPNSQDLQHANSNNNAKVSEWISPDLQNGTCPKNMQLYIAYKNSNISVCDCRPKFLYFPSNDTCHEAYRQGPCPPHHYVVLPKGEAIPKCERNPCREDGVVRYNNTCHGLKTIGGPCQGILEVNETTYEVECVKADVEKHTIIDPPKRPCPAGSRRSKLGMCTKII